MNAVELLLSDARGVYIPRDFVEGFDLAEWGIDAESWGVQTCASGPEAEGYWDAWDKVLYRAEYRKGDHVWRLHHDGDLWAICYELMTDEEKQNFGFEEEDND